MDIYGKRTGLCFETSLNSACFELSHIVLLPKQTPVLFFHWVSGRERSWKTKAGANQCANVELDFLKKKNKHTDTSISKIVNATMILAVNVI